MNIDDVLTAEIIDLAIVATTKLDALNHLIALLYSAGRISSPEKFLDQVLEREKIEATDLGIGVAIPHGRTEVVVEPSIAIGKLIDPIIWDLMAEPGKPVTSIFLMASTPDASKISHMEIIAKVATLLIEDEFIDFLNHNQDPHALLEEIKTYLGKG